MLSKGEALQVLDRWQQINDLLKQNALQRCRRERKRPDVVRVNIIRGQQIIQNFNRAGWDRQRQVQAQLTAEFPDFTEVINATPEIDGDWKLVDYLDLYHNHYDVVIEKLRPLIRGL